MTRPRYPSGEDGPKINKDEMVRIVEGYSQQMLQQHMSPGIGELSTGSTYQVEVVPASDTVDDQIASIYS